MLLMCSSYPVFSFTIFFLNLFLFLYFWYIFFSSKEHTRTNHKKYELNWIKDVVYAKSGLCSQMHAKLFAILIFVNLAKVCTFLSLDAKFFVVLRRYKVCTFLRSDTKVMTVLWKTVESGSYIDERCGSCGWWWQGLMENKGETHKLDWNTI